MKIQRARTLSIVLCGLLFPCISAQEPTEAPIDDFDGDCFQDAQCVSGCCGVLGVEGITDGLCQAFRTQEIGEECFADCSCMSGNCVADFLDGLVFSCEEAKEPTEPTSEPAPTPEAPPVPPPTTTTVEVGETGELIVTASNFDSRNNTENGCFDTGCIPELTRDGQDNTVLESRWSCEKPDMSELECFITFEFEQDVAVDHVTIWFRQSDDTTRAANPFIVATRTDDDGYTLQLEGVNTPGTPLGQGETFTLPAPVTAKFVRMQFPLVIGQWISVNEVEINIQTPDGDEEETADTGEEEEVTAADEDSSSAHAALVGTAGKGFAMAVGVLVSVAMGLLW